MTVAELIEELKKQPEYLTVKLGHAKLYHSNHVMVYIDDILNGVTDKNTDQEHFIVLF